MTERGAREEKRALPAEKSGMILLLGAMVVGLAVALAPVWPYSRGRSWWPALILLAILILVAGLMAIERIEAADDVQGVALDAARSSASQRLA